MKNLNTKTIEYSRDGTVNKITIEKGINQLLFSYKFYTHESKIKEFIVLVQNDGLTIKRRNEQTLIYEVYEKIHIIKGGLE